MVSTKMSDQGCSDSDQSRRDIPSFIEPRPPLILNPFMRPKPQKGTNLLELFEEDSEIDEPEWVQVYLRVKPGELPSNLYEVRSDKCLITSLDTTTAGHGRRTQHNVSKMYTFSHIFGPESDQKEIFESVVKDNLKKLPDGHNFTLLTYGASGSGKTFTLMGTVQSPGLVPRSLEYVFRVVDAAQQPLYKPADGGADCLNYLDQEYELKWVKRLRHVSAPLRDKYRRMSAQLRSDLTSTLDLSNRTRHYVWVSFVEIYNEAIYDLLANGDRSKATSKLRIREDSHGHAYVKGATQAFVRSGSEAYDVLAAGKHNLQVAATGIHALSSRSHCIFTITMLTETESGVRTSCVRLCDLAGCERARQTRNTGARMQESRAINSSLHVLERCLTMLRRKQRREDATLVPYRESKLTRLLGAGLSGARGESVAMVVTLNPAPAAASEARHVLQLAAVARDIQVNNTIAESTLESSSHMSTIDSRGDVMKLRAENERLHFELIQAECRNKELMATMEEKQQQAASTMYEIAEDAKDLTKQYYEAQMQALTAEMGEMQEEYENKLKATALRCHAQGPPGDSEATSNTHILDNKITQLLTEIAILEEKLTAEKLARARAEEEVQHLRACIDERDEKSHEEETKDEEASVTDSEGDSEDDPCNESLEPTFKKEDINRSRMIHQSLITDDNVSESEVSCDDDEKDVHDSIIEQPNATLKDPSDVSNVTAKGDDGDDVNSDGDKFHSMEVATDVAEVRDKSYITRETYFVKDSGVFNVSDENKHSNNSDTSHKDMTESKPQVHGTYFVSESKLTDSFDSDVKRVPSKESSVCSENSVNSPVVRDDFKEPKVVNKIVNKLTKTSQDSDVSLYQFEQLEMATNNETKTKQREASLAAKDIKNLTKEKSYFDDLKEEVTEHKETKTYFNNINFNIESKQAPQIKNALLLEDRSPSIVKDEVLQDFEPNKIKMLLGESFTRQSDVLSSVIKPTVYHKKPSVDIFDSPCSMPNFDTPNEIKTVQSKNKIELPKVDPDDSIIKRCLEKPGVSERFKDNLKKFKSAYVCLEDIELPIKGKAKIETLASKPGLSESNEKKQDEVAKIIDDSKNQVSNIIEATRKSIEKLVLNQKTEHEKISTTLVKEEFIEPGQSEIEVKTKEDNEKNTNKIEFSVVNDFEDIYKDISKSRATEFDLLVTQETFNETETRKYNLRHKTNTSVDQGNKTEVNEIQTIIETKSDDKETKIEKTETSKCETKPKRNLRLRRRKNQSDEDVKECAKLKDIVNLQKEFSDVTLDVPATKKVVYDIESPEKDVEQENHPPLLGIQSCPSKSVTRSRRKLFTPRAEPLDESLNQSQSGEPRERVRIPRPSYHRGRARRKL